MSGFNWNDHPIVEAPKADKGFNWNDHPVVSSVEDQTPLAASAAAGFEKSVPFSGQIGAAGKTAMDVITGVTDPSDALDEYRSQRDQIKQGLSTTAAAHPGASLAGGLAAFPLMPIGASVPAMAAYGGANALSESGADLTRGEVGRAAKDTALGAGTGALLGAAGEEVLPAIESGSQKVADYIKKKYADKLFLQATKIPGATAFEKLKDNAPDVLRNYVGFGNSQEQIAGKLAAGRDAAGQDIGNILSQLTEQGAGKSQGEIIDSLRSKAADLKKVGATIPVGDKLEALADRLEQQASPVANSAEVASANATDAADHPFLNPEEIANEKRIYARRAKNKFGDSLDPDVNKEASGVYRQAENDTAEQAGVGDQLQGAKDNFGDLKQLADLSEKRAAVLSQNSSSGYNALGHRLVGATLGGEEGYRHGGALGGIGGALAGAAGGAAFDSLVGSRTLASKAVGADFLSNLVRTSPQTLGKWAPTLTQAANRGETSLAATDYILQSTDPNYQRTLQSLKNDPQEQK